MKLYKFRPLGSCEDFCRIAEIIEEGFYCPDFLSFNDVNEGVFSVNSQTESITLGDKKKYKICSFSRKRALRSQLMWAHYANSGMGVAIEVDITDCSDIDNIKKVSYGNNRSYSGDIEKILTRKSKAWKYEHECRYIIEDDKKGAVTKKIGGIAKIYFGTPYEQLKNYNEINGQHEKLEEYSKLKYRLMKYVENRCIHCEDFDVDCEDFYFKKLNKTN